MMAYRLRGLGSTVDDALSAAAGKWSVPLPLLRSVAQSESGFNPRAISPKGAQGLLQLMPGTAKDLGVTDPFDAFQSADGGAKYLSQLYGKYGNWSDALIAYNEGPGTFGRGVIYPESQAYADTILGRAGFDAAPPADPGAPVGWEGAPADEGSGLPPVALLGLGLAAVGLLWTVID
jgi:soluble lytic murein transglycosylase-like protein